MTPDRYRPVDTDEVLRRVDTHARVGAALLGGLGEVGHEEEDAAFTSELVTAARNAAEHELADVAYDLARACFAANREHCESFTWIEDPREVAELHTAIRVLQARVHPEARSSTLPAPGAESDLRPLLSCIEMCAELEGQSDRVRYISALVPGIHGQWDRVESLSRELARSAATAAWRRCAHLQVLVAFVEQERPEEALVEAAEIAQEFGVDRSLLANLASAHALRGDVIAFRECAARFKDAPAASEADAEGWRSALKAKAGWFGRRLGIAPSEALDAFGLEAAQ